MFNKIIMKIKNKPSLKLILLILINIQVYAQRQLDTIYQCTDSVLYLSHEFNFEIHRIELNKPIRNSINYSYNYIEKKAQNCDGLFLIKIYNKDSVLLERGYLKGCKPYKTVEKLYSMAVNADGSHNSNDTVPLKENSVWGSNLLKYGEWEYLNKVGSIIATKMYNIKNYTKAYALNEDKIIEKRKKIYLKTYKSLIKESKIP